MLLGRVAHLGIDDVVGAQVLGTFGGYPDQCVPLLHDSHGVGERLEIPLEGTRAGHVHEPGREFVRITGGQIVSDLAGQLHDRCGSQAAVEVVVQQNFGRDGDFVRSRRHEVTVPRSLLAASRPFVGFANR